jgi:hypothetical protein
MPKEERREPLLKGRLGTVDFLIKMPRFVKRKVLFSIIKAADLN